MKILQIGHSLYSLKIHPEGIGEIRVSERFEQLFIDLNISSSLIDLYKLFKNYKEYEMAARLNIALVETNHFPLAIRKHKTFQAVFKQVQAFNPDCLLVSTWSWGLAALACCDIAAIAPTIEKLYVFHPNEVVFPKLYAKANVLITESLLANKKGKEYGLSSGKMIYLPHAYHPYSEKAVPKAHYLRQFQSSFLRKKSIVIGICSRIEGRKNIFSVLYTLKILFEEGYPIICILKGKDNQLEEGLKPLWKEYQKEKWLIWDQTRTAYPEVLSEFCHFDICLHLSGFEGASNTVIDYLSLGKPTIVLNATTNPSLFKGGALFCRAVPQMVFGQTPYALPDLNHLKELIVQLICSEQLRVEWGQKGLKICHMRFNFSELKKRMCLAINAAIEFHKGKSSLEAKIKALFEKDLETYQL